MWFMYGINYSREGKEVSRELSNSNYVVEENRHGRSSRSIQMYL